MLKSNFLTSNFNKTWDIINFSFILQFKSYNIRTIGNFCFRKVFCFYFRYISKISNLLNNFLTIYNIINKKSNSILILINSPSNSFPSKLNLYIIYYNICIKKLLRSTSLRNLISISPFILIFSYAIN